MKIEITVQAEIDEEGYCDNIQVDANSKDIGIQSTVLTEGLNLVIRGYEAHYPKEAGKLMKDVQDYWHKIYIATNLEIETDKHEKKE